MASILLHCPQCGQSYQMSPEQITKYAGRSITCRKCKLPFAFDAAMDAAAQAAGRMEAPMENFGVAAPVGGAAPVAHAPPMGHAAPADPAGGAGYDMAPPAAQTAPPPAWPSPANPQPQGFPPGAAAPMPQGYPPQGQYAPQPGYAPGPPSALGEILAFRQLLLPRIATIVQWIGFGTFALLGLLSLYRSVDYLASDNYFMRGGSRAMASLMSLLEAVLYLVILPVILRGVLEIAVTLQRSKNNG